MKPTPGKARARGRHHVAARAGEPRRAPASSKARPTSSSTPGFEFRVVEAPAHQLPPAASTLLMLVSRVRRHGEHPQGLPPRDRRALPLLLLRRRDADRAMKFQRRCEPDGAGAPRRARARARQRRHAGVHAGRHLRHGQGDVARGAARARRADRARQHLPPLAAPGARGDRQARRAAPLHGLGRGRSSPTRAASRSSASATLRKISEEGVQFASPINGDRLFLTPEESMRIQHALDSDIAMVFDECTAVPGDREAGGGLDAAVDALGASARRTTWQSDNALFGIVQGGMYEALRDESLDELERDRLRRLRDRRPLGGRAEGGARAHPRAHRAAPAGGPAALPDGRGHAGGPRRGGGGGHRHVRLRAADAQRAQRLAVHAPRRHQHPQRALPRRHRAARRALRLLHLPQLHAAPTCTTCRRRTRSSARGSTRCTTCTTTRS